MADPLRHRQTKGAATDMVDLTPPRHIPTLPRAAVVARLMVRPVRPQLRKCPCAVNACARPRARCRRKSRSWSPQGGPRRKSGPTCWRTISLRSPGSGWDPELLRLGLGAYEEAGVMGRI